MDNATAYKNAKSWESICHYDKYTILNCAGIQLDLLHVAALREQMLRILFPVFALWLLTVSRGSNSHHDRLLSRILNWLLSRICNRLVGLLFCALWDNHHSRLLDDTRMTCLLLGNEFLRPLLPVQLVMEENIHDENYKGDVTEGLSKHSKKLSRTLNSFSLIGWTIIKWLSAGIGCGGQSTKRNSASKKLEKKKRMHRETKKRSYTIKFAAKQIKPSPSLPST